MNLKSMAVVAMASGVVTSLASGDAVQWRVQDGGNGHWYRVHIGPPNMTAEQADAVASKVGGHLVTFGSQSESQFVVSLVGGTTATLCPLGPWIGLVQDLNSPDYSEPSGGWRWVDGTTASIGWQAPLNPNNDCFGVAENYANMTFEGQINDLAADPSCTGYWPNGAINSAVIEWSSDCNSDGVVDYGQCRDGSLPDFNGNNIPDCCEEGTACVVGQFPTQWKISEGGNGHWYRLNVGGPFTWTAARALAEARGGYLGTVTSAAEDRFIRDLIRVPAAFDLFVGPWLGGYQDVTAPDYSEPTGGWRWVTGEPWYAGWTGVEPNGGPLENLLHIAGTAPNFNDLNWNDFYEGFPTQPRSCVIEWSSDCNSDGIVDYGQILNGELADANGNGVPDVCEQTPCPGDIAADGVVNGVDLAAVLNNWGTTGGALGADANGDGVVDGADLALVLNSWGPCPK